MVFLKSQPPNPMSTSPFKKLTLQLPTDLLKAAKCRAQAQEQTLAEWVLQLIQQDLQAQEAPVIPASDWGRIDSRIDQRTAFLERRLDLLATQMQSLMSESPELLDCNYSELPTPIHLNIPIDRAG